MKKVFFFIAALFTTYFAQAQEGIKLGLKAGVNVSSVVGKDEENLGNLLGLHAGGFLDYGLTEQFSIRPELLYSMKGFYAEADEEDFEYKSYLTTHYIELPVLARFKAGNFFVEAGPTFSYLLSAKTREEGELLGEEFEETKTVTDELNKFDLGVAAGFGYQFQSGLGLGLRYTRGLSKLDKSEEAKVYNSSFQLGVSYTLR
ncbi:porin family protein [Rufibacter hautae]|uniref:PorT family protein n=1 Tax=Rufibacter hautae TaxID=2595005 RepID=A0A5B6TJC1_9BACT|nr:porin family protein [Rufibacter hautae]KAA3440772.1 PorT family protein [Rufibacter hautae]